MKLAATILLATLCALATVAETPCLQPENARPADSCVDSMPPVATNFNLAGGVIWKKFGKVKDKYVLGKPAEGRAITLFKTCLKSKNAELAAEAQTILDAFEATRDILGERLEQARAAGCPGTEEWIRLYLQSYPSRRRRFAKPSNHQTIKPSNHQTRPRHEGVSKNGL